MKVYLVGGAVRDQLLGLPIKERDWVVIGAQPEQLIASGYRQVGRDFPVFLHPDTQEEYALARTEKKRGVGYYGFDCDASPNISLEEDLQRRDLTINAMAMDKQGNIIDPYGGQNDLGNKLLKHVSPAFVEDPVRVLRVARFMARFQSLGFHVAPETRLLIQHMVRSGELQHLVAERVWQEWQQSLNEKDPLAFIATLRACGALRAILPEIDSLFGIPNFPQQLAEIDVGIHCGVSLEKASRLTTDPVIRFAALVQDMGKTTTPYAQWPHHPNYEKAGVELIKQLCRRLTIPNRFQKLALLAARWHLTVHRIRTLPEEIILDLFSAAQAWQQDVLFEQLLTVCEADVHHNPSMTKNDHHDYRQANDWRVLLTECRKVTAQPYIEQGYTGSAIKEALYAARLDCLKRIRLTYE